MSTWAAPSRPPDELKVVPLGGLGEIGMNMLVLECRDRILVIDAGVMFPNEEMLGVDLVIPDAGYLFKNREKIEAIVLTHGHEDHIGALPFILPKLQNPPIYGSSFTLALVQEKLKEYRVEARLEPVEGGEKQPLGPFVVEFIPVAHSIPEGFGLCIQTPLGFIVHSGDFKIDHLLPPDQATDLNRFASCGERDVLLMLSDSTNVEREGQTLSENLVRKALNEIFSQAGGKIMVASFASSIHRVQQVVDLAAEQGRKVAFTGKSLVVNVRLAKELGLLVVPKGLEVTLADLGALPPREVCILSTGSQGEPLSALSRIAMGEHKQVQVAEGDVVVLSSRFIPGHELAITRLINLLYRRGAEVYYERVGQIHSSGHAYQEELKLLLRLVKPRYFVPVHGETRHLVRHTRLAQALGLSPQRTIRLEDGDMAVFNREGFKSLSRVESGRVYVDGKGVGDVGDAILRDRMHLSSEGVVFVMLAVDRRTGEIVSGPEVITRGFIFEEEQADLLETAKNLVVQACQGLTEPDYTVAQDDIRRTLRRFFDKQLDRRPMILPMILPM